MAQIPISNPKMKSFTEDEYLAIQAATQARDLDESHKQVLSKLIKTPEKHNGVADLYVDGAADLHTKTAGIGGAIFMNGKEIISFSEPLIDKTNNEAEYMAMIKGVHVSLEINIANLYIYSDSELIVNQINGKYKVKNDRMKQLHSSVMFELNQMDHWSVAHVRREKNTRADALSKNGMQKARESK
jgi:ribonuclease HI